MITLNNMIRVSVFQRLFSETSRMLGLPNIEIQESTTVLEHEPEVITDFFILLIFGIIFDIGV